MWGNDLDKKRNEMKLPIYMKAGKDRKTIIVKWWGVIYLKLRYVYLSIVSKRPDPYKCKECGMVFLTIRCREQHNRFDRCGC